MNSKKFISLVLAIVLTIVASIPAFAQVPKTEETTVSPRYVYIGDINPFISKSGTKAICSCSVQVPQSSSVTITMTLQKKTNTWGTYESFIPYTEDVSEGNAAGISKTSKTLTSGEYRVKAVVRVQTASGNIETETVYSASIIM